MYTKGSVEDALGAGGMAEEEGQRLGIESRTQRASPGPAGVGWAIKRAEQDPVALPSVAGPGRCRGEGWTKIELVPATLTSLFLMNSLRLSVCGR